MWGTRYPAALAAATAMLCLPPPAIAQAADSGTASIDIINSTRLQKEADLRFGRLVPGTAGGTITVAPNGGVSTTGTVSRSGGQTGAAAFSFERRVFRDYPSYAGPGAGTQIELVNPAAPGRPMRLRNFTTDFSQFAYWFSSNYTFHVGGTLDVASDQPPGRYTGTFIVTLDNF